METQESCFQGGSSWFERVTEMDGEVGMLENWVPLVSAELEADSPQPK